MMTALPQFFACHIYIKFYMTIIFTSDYGRLTTDIPSKDPLHNL